MNLYIIGPITGIENDNRAEFERVRRELKKVQPISTVPENLVYTPFDAAVPELMDTWENAMRYSIAFMLIGDGYVMPRPDGIAMLDGWENSKGATIEHDLAVALGIPCKPWKEWL